MYRATVDVAKGTHTFDLPESWFPYIVKDPWVHLSPYKHFGSAWGEVQEDGQKFKIHTSTSGQWRVLITGVRNDECGKMCSSSPIEFQEEIPPEDIR